MSCSLADRISLLIDGELLPVETGAIERHLLDCAECQQIRTDFLNLRCQLDAYEPTLDQLAVQTALARVLAKPDITIVRQGWYERFSGAFGVHRFNPALAAAVLLVVFAGALAFLFYRLHNDRAVPSRPDYVPSDRQSALPSNATSPTPITQSQPSSGPSTSKDKTGGAHASGPQRREQKANGQTAKVAAKSVRDAQTASRSNKRDGVIATDSEMASNREVEASSAEAVRPEDAESLTARHLEQSELLLRAFRNIRIGEAVETSEFSYERQRAQQLFYRNIMLRREADSAGDAQVASLLDSLEPILLDIANLANQPQDDDVRAIKERVKRKNLVALLQVNSAALARANE